MRRSGFGPEIVGVDTNLGLTAGMAAILGLGFNQSACLAEIICAGFWYLSITSMLKVGQHDLERHSAKGGARYNRGAPSG